MLWFFYSKTFPQLIMVCMLAALALHFVYVPTGYFMTLHSVPELTAPVCCLTVTMTTEWKLLCLSTS